MKKNVKKAIVSSLIAVFVLSLIAGLTPLDLVQPVSAASTKKAQIRIDNTGGCALSYYQVNLNITYDSDMNNNFSDIWVADETAGVFVPYWIENKSDGAWCDLWFNATSIPASAWCNDTYYLYYGDTAASSASNGTNTFEFFDDFLGPHWTKLADMPAGLQQFGFEELNDILYAVCGHGFAGNVNTTFAYDIANNTWTEKSAIPGLPRESPILRAVNGKLYLIGGYIQDVGTYKSNETFEYNPSNDTWTQKANMPTAREDMASAVVDGKIYVLAGITSPGHTLTRKIEVYDPATDTWETKDDMPYDWWSGDFGCSYNGKIYLVSSSDTMADYPILYPIAKVVEYDPVAETWTQKADIPTPRCYKEVEELNGELYVMCGATITTTTSTNKSEIYNICDDSWTTGVNAPYSTKGASLTKYNEKIYLCGGGMATNNKKDLYRFDPFAPFNPFDIQWTRHMKGTDDAIIEIVNNQLHLAGKPGNISSANIKTVRTFTNNIAIELRREQLTDGCYRHLSFGGGNIVDHLGGTTRWDGSVLQSGYTARILSDEKALLSRTPTSGSTVTIGTEWNPTDAPTDYEIHKIIYDSDGNLKWYVNNILEDSAVDSTFLSNEKKIMISQGEYTDGRGGDTYVDWIFVRKCVSPMLTVSFGEEQNLTTPSISNLSANNIKATTASITWSVNQSTNNRVFYSKNVNLTDGVWSLWSNNTDLVSIGLSGLDSETLYYYQAWSHSFYSHNLSDSEPASEPYESFVTSAGQIIMKKFTDITKTSIVLMGILAIVVLAVLITSVLLNIQSGEDIDLKIIMISAGGLIAFMIMMFVALSIFSVFT